MRQKAIGLLAQFLQLLVRIGDKVPLVQAKHERPALAFDKIGDGEILLLEGNGRVEQHDDDFGETHGAQRIGDGKLLQLVLHVGPPAHPGSVPQLDRARTGGARPHEIDADGIARDACFRSGEQTLLAKDAIDQSRLAGVGPADDGDPQRLRDVEFAAVFLIVEDERLLRVFVNLGGFGCLFGSAASMAS